MRHLVRGIGVLLVTAILVPLALIELIFRFDPAFLERLDQHRRQGPVSPREMVVPDRDVGLIGNKAFPGHDDRGWRNKVALSRADIIVFGDSQTYGLNASMDLAWPQQLGNIIDKTVYQFAIGGAGPFNHALLIDKALALRPSLVLATVYFGNDLVDSYRWAHQAVPVSYEVESAFPSDLMSAVNRIAKSELRAIDRAEASDPRHFRHSFLDCQGPRPVPDPILQSVGAVTRLPILLSRAYAPNAIVGTAMDYSLAFRAIYVRTSTPDWLRATAPMYPDPVCVQIDLPGLSTVLAPAYRMVALDPSDARVREGRRLTVASLLYMKDRAQAAGAQFLTLLIPTKELAFRRAILEAGLDAASLEPMWNAEMVHRSAIVEELHRRQIVVADALPGLEEAIARGDNPYPLAVGDPRVDADGHPRAEGYAIIARGVAKAISRYSLLGKVH